MNLQVYYTEISCVKYLYGLFSWPGFKNQYMCNSSNTVLKIYGLDGPVCERLWTLGYQ